MEFTKLLAQLCIRARHGDLWGDSVDRKWCDRPGRDVPLPMPSRELFAAAGIHDPSQPDPGMGCGAHRTVLAGGIDRRAGTLCGNEVLCRPSGDLELGMAGLIAAGNAIPICESLFPVSIDQDRTKGLVPILERFAGQVYAAMQKPSVLLGELSRNSHVDNQPTEAEP